MTEREKQPPPLQNVRQRQRAERLAAELRANLKKRKAATRAAGQADATGAAVSGESSDDPQA
jgi:hypothetical protein